MHYLNDYALRYQTRRVRATSLLQLEVPDVSHLLAYADAFASLAPVCTVKQAELQNTEITEHRLSLALKKTKVLVLKKERVTTVSPIPVGEIKVLSISAVQHLGIMIDTKMSCFEQIRKIADKAAV